MSSEPLTYEELWGTPPPDEATHERGHQNPDQTTAQELAEVERVAEAQLQMMQFSED